MIAYTGATTFITNTDLVSNPPKSWDDVRKGDYKLTIGDVVTGATGQGNVLATGLCLRRRYGQSGTRL